MDTHLRPYFSSNSLQFSIDASLFAKTLESVHPAVAKKLFVEMGIKPVRVCRPWSVPLSLLVVRVRALTHLQVLVAFRRGASNGIFSARMGHLPKRWYVCGTHLLSISHTHFFLQAWYSSS